MHKSKSFSATFLIIGALFLLTASATQAAEGDGEIAGRTTTRIGSITKLTGNATAKAEEHVSKRKLKQSDSVYERETVQTLSRSRLELTLSDESVIQLGPKGKLVLSEFLYNKDSSDCKCGVEVGEGLLRLVGGAVAKMDPESVKVKTPSATIGIRGTISCIKASAEETVQYCEEGTTTVSNEFGVVVTEAGQACVVKAGEAPGKPFTADASFIASLDPMTAGDEGMIDNLVPAEQRQYIPLVYLVIALIFAIKAMHCRRTARHHPKRFIWWALAIVMIVLALNAKFGLF